MNMASRIYFDHAATTPVRDEVIAVMEELWKVGNPSSTHRRGQKAKAIVDHARQQVATQLEVEPEEIIFCASASEANNLALRGILEKQSASKPAALLTSAIEHPSIRNCARYLSQRGIHHHQLAPDPQGRTPVASLRQALEGSRFSAGLLSVMLVNNEIGSVAPIADLAAMARAAGLWVHCDAVQGFWYFDARPRELGADLMTLSGHKIGGPRGIGLLYAKKGVDLSPLVWGGSQEYGHRAGTENVAAIAGMALAMRLAQKERAEALNERRALRQQLIAEIAQELPQAQVLGALEEDAPVAPQILAVALPNIKADAMVTLLDQEGLMLSSGSACSGHAVQVSHVIRALDLAPELRHGVLRFSFGRGNRPEEVSRAVQLVATLYKNMRGSAA